MSCSSRSHHLGTEIFNFSWDILPARLVKYIHIYRSYHLLSLRNPSARVERGVVQLGLGADDHSAVASELEVRAGGAQVNLAEELARGVPDLDAVAAARVNIAVGVGVYTIWRARINKGERFAVDPGAVLEDFEAVAVGG